MENQQSSCIYFISIYNSRRQYFTLFLVLRRGGNIGNLRLEISSTILLSAHLCSCNPKFVKVLFHFPYILRTYAWSLYSELLPLLRAAIKPWLFECSPFWWCTWHKSRHDWQGQPNKVSLFAPSYHFRKSPHINWLENNIVYIFCLSILKFIKMHLSLPEMPRPSPSLHFRAEG